MNNATVQRATAAESNSDEQMKMALAMALLRSKLLRQPQSSSHASDALRWKQKAKQRKQEIFKLTKELKEADEDGIRRDLYPENAICKCFFLSDMEKENMWSKRFTDGCESDNRFTDVLRRRFLREVRLHERKKRRTNGWIGEGAFEEFHREEEVEQLKVSANFLADLCNKPSVVKRPHFSNWVHQAVDFIIGSLNHVLPLRKNLDLIEGIVNSLVVHLVKRMCTPLEDELCDYETDTQTHIQQIIRKLGSISYVGQRALLFLSHRISEAADKLLFLDPFDESFPNTHDSMFLMIQLVEFLVSDYLITWFKAEDFETTLFEEWVASLLHARKAVQAIEKRSGLYVLYMDRVIAELSTQAGQTSSLQYLNHDILNQLFS